MGKISEEKQILREIDATIKQRERDLSPATMTQKRKRAIWAAAQTTLEALWEKYHKVIVRKIALKRAKQKPKIGAKNRKHRMI
ncbi:MAG: hypothetical protein Q7S21_00310 [archaeon]|nr:hypothetical protein [archaeon]